MTEYLFRLPDSRSGTLQSQIQTMMVDGIFSRHLAPGSALPSSRKLASQLSVARNTVVLAYQALMDEGFIVAKERSGFYISTDVLEGFAHAPSSSVNDGEAKNNKNTAQLNWSNRLSQQPASLPYLKKPQDWQKYPYPFVYGQFDQNLFPIADWRECCREASAISSIHGWASDHVDQDSELLLEQVHRKLLPRRGIWANRDEILITVGAQNAIFLASSLLLDSNKTIGMENPGYVDAMNAFRAQTNNVTLLDIDDNGIVVNDKLDGCDCIYVTPSHQFPTTVTMNQQRRLDLLKAANKNDVILIEDDYESEYNYADKPVPALKSLDNEGRVVYVGSLSKTLAPGIRLGYMVASPELIKQAKALRRIMLRHPPSNNQFIIGQFLKRGYHDSLIRRIGEKLNKRSHAMKEALDTHFPGAAKKQDFGGSSYWVEGPEGLDAKQLAIKAKEQGILIEPSSAFFYPGTEQPNCFRLGFSSISEEKIKQGIPLLKALI